MTQEEQQQAFIDFLRGSINRFAQEYDLTYISMIGCMQSIIIDLKLEEKYQTPLDYADDGEYEHIEDEDDEYDDGEEYDGDEWKKD